MCACVCMGVYLSDCMPIYIYIYIYIYNVISTISVLVSPFLSFLDIFPSRPVPSHPVTFSLFPSLAWSLPSSLHSTHTLLSPCLLSLPPPSRLLCHPFPPPLTHSICIIKSFISIVIAETNLPLLTTLIVLTNLSLLTTLIVLTNLSLLTNLIVLTSGSRETDEVQHSQRKIAAASHGTTV